MLSALVALNAESNGIVGLFITLMIFFVFLALMSFIDNIETMLSACFVTTVVSIILWFNAVINFEVFLFWTILLMVIGAWKIWKG